MASSSTKASLKASDLQAGLIVRGIITLAFGFAAVFWPGETLLTLLYLFSAWVVVIGIISTIEGVMSIGHKDLWFLRILVGLFELGVGVYLLRHIHVTFTTFILLIGFALIVRGIVGVVSAFVEDSPSSNNRILDAIMGLLALGVGIFVLFQPARSGVSFVWILGLYALLAGTLEIAAAVQVRNTLRELEK